MMAMYLEVTRIQESDEYGICFGEMGQEREIVLVFVKRSRAETGFK